MRTANLTLREHLQRALRAAPRRGTTELATLLGVTAQSVRRLLAELPGESLLSAGQTRRIRYALRRPLRGKPDDIPVYTIDSQGRAAPLAPLSLVQPQGSLLPLQSTVWPVPAESRDGWWDGLPYPIYAVRPTGYMGRQLARSEYLTLGVSDEPDTWSDDDVVWVLSRRGPDVTGNLLLGGASYDIWFRNKLQDPQPHTDKTLPEVYSQLAGQAVALGGGGSSAAGEFPKFAAMRELDDALTPHVLVKFSGAGGSASEQRWGDLLVCEHLALECARKLPGISAARSRILSHDGRVFIEVERFDRVGVHGRLSLCGLDAIQPTFLGDQETSWPPLMRQLAAVGLIDSNSVAAVEGLWWFGRLIANTDMHLGNISFYVDRTFRLAPAYDMLPMTYAPLAGGEVPLRTFVPEFPRPHQRDTWLLACAGAIAFWTIATADTRISEAFRTICRANAELLRTVIDRV
ncbi:MAG: type II toxin-antitoxin system HipA family toxin YjjJ [Betaproteobacteria bacterium]